MQHIYKKKDDIIEIDNANIEDCEIIMSVIASSICHMESQDIYMWNDKYPDVDIIKNDIRNKSGYLIKRNDERIGFFSIDEHQPEEYRNIKWSNNAAISLVVHRLVVDPLYQRKGVAKAFIEFVEGYAKVGSYVDIRFDVFSDNTVAIKFYEKMGYRKTGEISFEHTAVPFFCYEKLL